MKPYRHLGLPAAIVLMLGVPAVATGEVVLPPGATARGTDRWRLRPADMATTGSTGTAPAKGSAISEIPEARRAVRVVYPGLAGGR